MTNVYRIAVTLTEDIEEELLQQALDMVLPQFDTFCVRLRKGIFWFYFEKNNQPAPKVSKENDYPCRYIEPYENQNYLFRVTYYKRRINLEVFHVLADGMGSVNFLREITYQYLRLKYASLQEQFSDVFSDETSLNTEDSYLKNYKRSRKKGYETDKAVHVRGERMPEGGMSVIHGYLSVRELKEIGKGYVPDGGISLQHLSGVPAWAAFPSACLCQHSGRFAPLF